MSLLAVTGRSSEARRNSHGSDYRGKANYAVGSVEKAGV